MPINFPTFEEMVNRSRAAIAGELPGVDPTIFASFVKAFSDSQSGRAFDIVVLMQLLILQLFPDTALADFLERWAAYEDLSKTPATEASGLITFTGTVASVINSGTSLQTAAGILYTTQSSLTLVNINISVSSLTRSGSTVTATTASDHSIASGQDVVIAGAVETDYNGTFTVTVTAANEFTYTITGTPTTPATGTITADFDGGVVEIESDEEGQDQNLASGAQLTLVTPVAGVDATARVQFSEVGGGTDEESDPNLKARTFQSRANPVANFNPAAIEKEALKVAGVTRVKVKRITPNIGDVTILFVRDNDTNIIPSAGEIADVKAAIVAILQATSAEDDVFVNDPPLIAVSTDYTFSSIIDSNGNDTPTMRTAIENSLAAFYRNEVDFETDVAENKYRAAISNTIDPETGATLVDFVLSTPVSDIPIFPPVNQIGVLGAVTFS